MSNQDRPAGKILRDGFFHAFRAPRFREYPGPQKREGKSHFPRVPFTEEGGVGKRLPLKKRPHEPDRREYPPVTPLFKQTAAAPFSRHTSLPGRNGTSGTRAKIHAAPAGKRHASLPISGNREACPQPNEKTPLREITFWRLLPHQARGPRFPQGRPAHYPSYKWASGPSSPGAACPSWKPFPSLSSVPRKPDSSFR